MHHVAKILEQNLAARIDGKTMKLRDSFSIFLMIDAFCVILLDIKVLLVS